MKTVKQQAEVSFKLLDFADKVVLLPIMDMLRQSVKHNTDIHIYIENRDFKIIMSADRTKKALKVLSDLGCRTMFGESYEDIVKSLNSQEEMLHIIHIDNPGQNKLQIVKIIKEQLNLGIREAKDLVDSYPVDIDFHTYGMPVQGCEILLDLLLKAGCSCYLKVKEQ